MTQYGRQTEYYRYNAAELLSPFAYSDDASTGPPTLLGRLDGREAGDPFFRLDKCHFRQLEDTTIPGS